MKTPTLLVVIGVVLILAGMVALANPFAASLAVTTIVGVIFLLSGVIQSWLLFRDGTVHGRGWNILAAVLAILVGVWLLANPLAGVVSLTLMVGALFFVTGITRLMTLGALRGTPFYWMMLISGLGSIAIGVLVLFDLGQAATTLLGVLLGIQLLIDGLGVAAIGLFSGRLNK